MDIKLILTLIGVGLTFVAPLPYMRDIIRGTTKPHIVTWLIWTVLVGTAFIFQIIGGGGIGSLVLGSTALANLAILLLSLRYARASITRFDIIILTSALVALILWRITSNPLLSVILITLVAEIGYIPTLRKAFKLPHEETLSLYLISAIKQLVGIAALSAYNPLTLLFPFAVFLTNVSFIAVLAFRRRHLKKA